MKVNGCKALQAHSGSKAIIDKHQEPENEHSSVVHLKNSGEKKITKDIILTEKVKTQ